MASARVQVLGTTLAISGWIMAIVVCALPMWRMNNYLSSQFGVTMTIWEGIWMNCGIVNMQSFQCKVHKSTMYLSFDLQAARVLSPTCISIGIVGFLLAIIRCKCIKCVKDESTKNKVGVASGVIFIISGFLCLIPVCWTASSILKKSYNPIVDHSQKMELGASLYIGWGAAALMIIGGGLILTHSGRAFHLLERRLKRETPQNKQQWKETAGKAWKPESEKKATLW